jgi:hypothetical protein
VSALQHLIDDAYEKAKRGDWDQVISDWSEVPILAQRCSKYQKPSSGWTFLHQAAYFGHEAACRELIRLGAQVGRLSSKGEAPADVSQRRGYSALTLLLRRAFQEEDSLWGAPKEPGLIPSSNLWNEAAVRYTTEVMLVVYGGRAIKIPMGSRYFVDSFGRTLIGWHGTYDPPCGMDAKPMV